MDHPMQFGHSRRGDFCLADGIAHLNHGAFGATPRVVLAVAQRWREQMEADPTGFFGGIFAPALREAAAWVARFLGGRAEDWAFIDNATGGINAIIASLLLEPGDEFLCLSQVYGAVSNALAYHAERAGARIVRVPMSVPFADPAPLLEALGAAIGPRTRLAVFDHIASPSAAVLPIAEMAAICHAKGVPVAIDGAHAPGQLSLDVPHLDVDWYVGNLHKWAFAAKGTAVIWCSPQRQPALHPPVISHGFGQGFAAEFDWTGTRDYSAWLAVPAALDYIESLGPAAIRAHNNALAREAGAMLAESWGTEMAAAPAFSAAMTAVRVPGCEGAVPAAARGLAARLRAEHGIAVGTAILDGALWLRVSAQLYNEIDDYRGLAAIGRALAVD